MMLSRQVICSVGLLVSACLVSLGFAVPCENSEGVPGVNEEYALLDKISILGFSAKVSYVDLPSGT